MGMIRNGAGNIQAFPLHLGTNVFDSGTTGFSIKSGSIVHMNADGNITLNHSGGSITVAVVAGSDWVIGDNIQSIDIDAACIIS
jgi:xanthine dehydrogenase molybdopterin-binding subunit B